jgi:hypothetical protein
MPEPAGVAGTAQPECSAPPGEDALPAVGKRRARTRTRTLPQLPTHRAPPLEAPVGQPHCASIDRDGEPVTEEVPKAQTDRCVCVCVWVYPMQGARIANPNTRHCIVMW